MYLNEEYCAKPVRNGPNMEPMAILTAAFPVIKNDNESEIGLSVDIIFSNIVKLTNFFSSNRFI